VEGVVQMSKQVAIDNWAFAQIPENANKGRIIALLGTLRHNGTFLAGSGRIVSFDEVAGIAKSESGTEYTLGEPDKSTTVDGLKKAISKYSPKT
jgi:hypothetical protein